MKHLEIEWRHLDKAGNTCHRCTDTGVALAEIMASLVTECQPCGWNITFKETKLDETAIAESNMIRINGVPIENILPNATASTSHCVSCCELFTGSQTTACRTVAVDEQSYEAIPVSLIRQAVCTVAQCC
jgi:predicted  nucleic acid-binding Zn-ribbon protein